VNGSASQFLGSLAVVITTTLAVLAIQYWQTL
jgi:hypothetical protein